MNTVIIKFIGIFLNATAVLFPKWNGAYAFNLLCKVKRVGVTEKGKQFLATAETQFLDIEGHSSALHRWGTGSKTILFLHGWMSNSERWLPYIEELDTSEYTIYALDAPGHGMAKGKYLNIEIYRKAVLAVIDSAGSIDTLICHSLGSLVGGYTYLSDSNISIHNYVIMGTPSGMDAIFLYFQNALGLSKKAISNVSRVVNTVLKVPHQEVTMRNFFKKIKKPVLVIHDTTDTITPFKPIEKAVQQNKEIVTLFTSKLKHDLKSEEVYQTVFEFIGKEKYETQEKTISA